MLKTKIDEKPFTEQELSFLSKIPRVRGSYSASTLRVTDLPADHKSRARKLFRYSAEYNAPVQTLSLLKHLAEFFGTEDVGIDVSQISRSGCETCDLGSDYGFEFVIRSPTRNTDFVFDDGGRKWEPDAKVQAEYEGKLE